MQRLSYWIFEKRVTLSAVYKIPTLNIQTLAKRARMEKDVPFKHLLKENCGAQIPKDKERHFVMIKAANSSRRHNTD